MVSDGEFADLLRRFEQVEQRVGKWAMNGMDAMDQMAALAFGNSNVLLGPNGLYVDTPIDQSDDYKRGIYLFDTNGNFYTNPEDTDNVVSLSGLLGTYTNLYELAYWAVRSTFQRAGVQLEFDDTSSSYARLFAAGNSAQDPVHYVYAKWDPGGGADGGEVGVTPALRFVDAGNNTVSGPSPGSTVAGSVWYVNGGTFHFKDAQGVRSLATANLLASSNSGTNNASDNTEKTFISVTIPARTIQGSDNEKRAIRVTAGGTYLNNSGSGSTLRLRVKFGGTTYWDDTSASIPSSATTVAWMFQCILTGSGDSAENMYGRFSLGAQAAATTGQGDLQTVDLISTTFAGAPAKDNTADQVFAFTAQNSVSDANTKLVMNHYSVEVI